MHTTIMTEQELDQLEELLDSDIFKDEAMSLDALQGFLCAVASGPELVPPSVWMHEALGESPAYKSLEQAQQVANLVMQFYNSIATALSNGDDFDLILYAFEENHEQLDYVPWCDAYVYGTQIGESNWFDAAGEFAEDLSEKMEVFFLLSGLLKEDAEKHNEPWLSAKEEKKAMTQAQEAFPSTIGEIHQFWVARRSTPETIRREAPKVGRNDPCPCGSGKKFKQCCGKEPTVH
ncbi:MAG: UPF0149 family protein [Sulfuricella sp.]|jgi:uncharacterized protein